MNARRHLLSTAAALALMATLAAPDEAQAQKKYDPGASDTEIVLGMPMPLSGPVSGYSIVGKVAEAHFKQVNEAGGINGRKVRVLVYDDQYSPPKTVEVARRMVEQDQILAMFGNLGTAPNLAIQRYMNAKKVPQLFVQSGAGKLNDAKNYPYTVPFLASYQGEGKAFAEAILKSKPHAKIAILMQNDDMGREVIKGLKATLGDKAASMIVAEATYESTDPTVDSQIVTLKSSGADVLVDVSTARFAAQAIRKMADMGWKPDHYLNLAAASVKLAFVPAGADKSLGVMSLAAVKEPDNERWAKDPEVLAYRAMLAKHAPDVDANVGTGVMGYVVAQLMEHVLRQAGDNLTRDNVRQIASNLKGVAPKMLLPGVTVNNSPEDLHAFSALQPVRFDGKDLMPTGPVLKLK